MNKRILFIGIFPKAFFYKGVSGNRTIRKYELKINLGFTEFDPSGAIEDLMARAAEARRERRRRPSTSPGRKRGEEE